MASIYWFLDLLSRLIPEPLIPVVFGWPAVLVGHAVLLASIVTKRSMLGTIGAVMVVPFFLYLSGTPRFRAVALIPIALSGAVPLIIKRSRVVAATMLVPGLVITLWLWLQVLRQ
jgi:hypothetical protein